MTDCTPLYTLVLIVFGIALGLLGIALDDYYRGWRMKWKSNKIIKTKGEL